MSVLIRVLAWLTFLVAGALTLIRFVQPDVPVVQQAVGFVPWSVPLFGLAMLFFLYHVFFPGKGRWQITMGLAGLALAGLGAQGWWMSPLFTGAKPEAGPDADRLTVLTVNLRTGLADPTDLMSTAVADGVDVLVLQEVTGNALSRLEQVGLDTAFPHRAGQPQTNGQYGTMLLSTANLGDITFLGTTQTSVQARVALPAGSIWVVGVGVPAPGGKAPTPWLHDLRQLVDTGASLRPAVMAGDFEATFGHQPFEDLLATGLRDAGERANAGWQPTWPVDRKTFSVPWPLLTQPDHVLLGSTLTAVDQVTVVVPGSDHRGVLATLAFR
jgi:endonuclease/exonuclease/phosphatase (EEP) superfamily protein YafD